ncbi:MAG: ribonuclease E inhibitor RraB, partial [Paludibacteraceae bacterium]|nr:ribonuclease E inhibitor RraB [Paludibacteraceae bacterium]
AYTYKPDELGKEIKKSKLIGKIGDNMNISSMIDKNWKIYQNELFPDQWNYQKIQNQRIIEDLQAKGDVNTKLHIVSHFISFPLDKKEEANNLAAKAKTWKYYVDQVEEEEGVVKVVFSKKSKTDIESITTVTNEVMNLAKEFGGEYVEWSTRVMRD